MKKLLLLTLIMFTGNLYISTYAIEDDLSELDALLNGEDTTTEDTTTEDTTTEDTTTEDTTTEDTTTEDTVGKVLIELTNNVTDGEVDIMVHKLGDYRDYKIYYSKEGDDALSETGVTIEGEGVETVKITGLEPGTTYNFIAKAFDNDGNPVESTTSDPLTVTIPENTESNEQAHAAPSDNVIYDPVIKVENDVIKISYKPGVDVKKVQISLSEDGQVFKPVATVDASQTTYEIKADKTGKKYIKIVPISEDGTLGVCKVGTSEVPFVTANVQMEKKVKNDMGKPKTGPETYVLLLLAMIITIAIIYRRRSA